MRVQLLPFLIRLDKLALLLGLAYYLLFLIFPTKFSGLEIADDPMSVSGFGVVLITVAMATHIQNKFPEILKLMIGKSLLVSPLAATEIKNKYDSLLLQSILLTNGILVPLALVGVYLADSNQIGKLHLLLGSCIAGFLISNRFGCAIATGYFTALFKKYEIETVLIPSSKDGASGHRPLGDFYFRQAVIVLVPSIFMGFWILAVIRQWAIAEPYTICNFDGTDCHGIWHEQFLRLITFDILVVFNFSVLFPAFFLSRSMKRFKKRYFYRKIAEAKSEIRKSIITAMQISEETGSATAYIENYMRDIKKRVEILEDFEMAKTWPIPLGQTFAAALANISALFGLITPVFST